MTLKELIRSKEGFISSGRDANDPVFRVLEELIQKKKLEYARDENDPVINAKIEKWIAEGRIHDGASLNTY